MLLLNLAQLNLNDKACLETATTHLDFLRKLLFDKTLTNALQEIQPVDFSDRKKALPVDMLMETGGQLTKINATLKHRLAQYTIPEHMKILRAEIKKLMMNNYLFFIHVVSNRKISQEHLIPSTKPQSSKFMLDKLRSYLSMFIATQSNTSSPLNHLIQFQTSAGNELAQPYFDCDPETKEWVGFSELNMYALGGKETGIYRLFLEIESINNMKEWLNKLGSVRALQANAKAKSETDKVIKEKDAIIEQHVSVIEQHAAVIEQKDIALQHERESKNQAILTFIDSELEEFFSENEDNLTSINIERIKNKISKKIIKIFSTDSEQHEEYRRYVDNYISKHLSALSLAEPLMMNNPAGLYAQPAGGKSESDIDKTQTFTPN